MNNKVFAVLLLCVFLAFSDYYVDSDSTNGTLANSTTGWTTPLGSAAFDSLLATTLTAGTKVFIRGKGTITLAANGDLTAEDGTTANPIKFIFVNPLCTDTGVNIDSADYAYDTIGWWCDFGGFTIAAGDNYGAYYGKFKSSCGATGSSSSPISFPQGGDIRECVFENDTTATTTSKRALTVTSCYVKKCTIKSLKTGGMSTGSSSLIEDCNLLGDRTIANCIGVTVGSAASSVVRGKFVNLRKAILVSATDCIVSGAIAYACSTAIDYTGGIRLRLLNLIAEKCYKQTIVSSARNDGDIIIGTHFGDSTGVHWTNVDTIGNAKDFRVTSGPCYFKDPLNFDFSTDSLNAPWLKKGY